MKKINVIIAAFTIMFAGVFQQVSAQTWKPYYDFERSKAGFEDADGNRKDMKYESTTLVDEANPLYSVVSIKKEGSENPLYGIVDNNTLEPIMPIKYSNIIVDKRIIILEQEVADEDNTNTLTEIYNTTLKKIYPKQLLNTFPSSHNNYVAFNDGEGENWKAGVIDADGKIVIPFKHGSIHIFDDNLFEVQPSILGPSTIIDNKNKVIIPEKANYDYYDYSKGFFVVHLKDEKGRNAFVNNLGQLIFKADVRESLHWGGGTDEFKCGYILSYDSTSLQRLYDLKGKLLLPGKYYTVRMFSCNLVQIDEGDFSNSKKGVFNLQLQKQIIPSEYKYISFDEEKNQLQAQKGANDPYVYFDTNGKVVTKK